jgi:hypothetical protein
MSGVSNKIEGDEYVPWPGRNLDKALFLAWQAGDTRACEEIWAIFNGRIFTVAVRFCQGFVDKPTAWQVATSGFSKAWEELELEVEIEAESSEGQEGTRRGRKQKKRRAPKKKMIAWQSGPQLQAFVRNLVILRCRDGLRTRWSWFDRFVDTQETEEESGADPLETLATVQATQEDDLLGREEDDLLPGGRIRDGVRRIVRELAALAESCRHTGRDGDADDASDRQALLEVIDAMRAYLRGRLIDAGRQDGLSMVDGRDLGDLSLDELVDCVDPESINATKGAMYDHIVESLKLANRNILYTRIADIRELRRQQSDDEDSAPA